MAKLPKNFPEYSIMYKKLNKKIQELKNKKSDTRDERIQNVVQSSIEKYQ